MAENKKVVYVCLSGKKGSGKSTVARMLASYLGKEEWKIVAFADPLKKLCSASYGFSIGLAYNRDGKDIRPSWAVVKSREELKVPPLITSEGILSGINHRTIDRLEAHVAREFAFMADVGIPITIGRILQTVGEFGRHLLGKSFWAKNLIKDCEAAVGSHFIVEDIRYPEEVAAMRQVGALFIRVERGEIPKDSRSNIHPSETSLDASSLDCFAVIDNNGSSMDLTEIIMCVARKISLAI